MTALGDVCTNTEITPNAGVKMIQVVTPATCIGGTDTVTVDLTKFGCRNIAAIFGCAQTTAGSIVATSAPTTAVSAGTLTITTAAGGTCKYTFIVWAY